LLRKLGQADVKKTRIKKNTAYVLHSGNIDSAGGNRLELAHHLERKTNFSIGQSRPLRKYVESGAFQ